MPLDKISFDLSHHKYRHPVEDKASAIENRIVNNGTIGNIIRLQAILFRLKMGQTLPEIKSDIPFIPTTKLIHARAYFASQYPHFYNPHFADGFKVLIDENIDQHIATDGARRAFGQAVHVSYVGLDTEKDINVWKYACANRFNIIITKDRAEVKGRDHLDLTRCATLKWKWRMQINGGRVDRYLRELPRLLQVNGAVMTGSDVAALLIQNKGSIVEIFEECISPKIILNRGSVKQGENFFEILEGKISPELEQQISKHTNRLLETFDTSQLEPIAIKRLKKTLRNEVMLEMAGDRSKIPFYGSEKRTQYINDIIAKELLAQIGHSDDIRAKQGCYSEFLERTALHHT